MITNIENKLKIAKTYQFIEDDDSIKEEKKWVLGRGVKELSLENAGDFIRTER